MKKSPIITKRDRKLYVLKTRRDIDILLACKRLERMRLSKQDRHLVRLIKSQLIDDWRKPLEKSVRKLEIKYR